MIEDSKRMERIISLAKQRGFIFNGSEIYGGLANTWDYGPLGAQMKKNIKDHWWSFFVEKTENIVGLDGSIIMNPAVWEASGHTKTFNDPLIECKSCNFRFRADKIDFKKKDGEFVSGNNIRGDDIKEIACPECNNIGDLTVPRNFNLMFQTHVGPVEGEGNNVYLRPETAQAIFINFKNVLNSEHQRVPFGIGQIGKAFRNEITPGNFIFRTLEFEQMEIEYFIKQDQWEDAFAFWLIKMKQWAELIGIDMEKLSEKDIAEDELAHYSKKTVDFEFEFPFGQEELWGLAYRTDFDLTNHQSKSGVNLEYTDPQDNKVKFIPHVIEPTMGVDRTMLALLVGAFYEEDVNGEIRTVIRLQPEIAPYQVAILPLQKKEQLVNKSKEIFEDLIAEFRCDFDQTQSIGKRYRRQDEIGTPLCITIDFDSLEDGAVTVRHRDSMKQDRIQIVDLKSEVRRKLKEWIV